MMIMNKILTRVFLTLLVTLATQSANASTEQQWRQLDENNTVLLTLPHGKVVIELAPQFSPKHVKQFSQLVTKGFYDGTSFYRVIDGFVAQAGPKDGSEKDKSVPLLAMEGEWLTDKNGHIPKYKHKIYLPLKPALKIASLWLITKTKIKKGKRG